jgi:hypothetical protein
MWEQRKRRKEKVEEDFIGLVFKNIDLIIEDRKYENNEV